MKIFLVQTDVNKFGLNVSESQFKSFYNNIRKAKWFRKDFKLKNIWIDYSFKTDYKLPHKKPDVYSKIRILFVNKKLINILNKYLSNIEYLPVTINNERFYAVNILKSLDVLDFNKSKCSINSNGEINYIDEYYFIKDKLKDKHLFKLKYTGDVLCSEEFINEIEKNNVIGFKFKEVWDSEVDITETSSNHGETTSEEYTFEQVLNIINEDNKAIFVSDEHIFKLDEEGLPVSGILYKHRGYQWKELAYLPPIFYNMKWKRLKSQIE